MLSEERRNASIVVVSEKARALKMTKAVFDYVIQSSNKITEQNQRMIAQVVLDSIPMFQKVPAHHRKAIVGAMNHVHYQPNQYLFRQFSSGETFYIVVEGTCKATQSYVEGGAEREINKFMVGDYIDEVALLDSSHMRSFNAISVNNLYCFVLSRNNFDLLMKSYSGGGLNKSIFENHLKKKKESGRNTQLRAGLRRITARDIDNQKNQEKTMKFLKLCCTFMAESLWISMYWRMFRSLSFSNSLHSKYGSQAKELMRQNYDRDTAVQAIALISKHILLRKPADRSESDIKWIAGLLHQKNQFTKRFCKNWTSKQFLLLAEKVRLHSVGAMARIFEKGAPANSAFLLLKGGVRLFNQQLNTVTNSRVLEYENDLAPGDVIGEAALGGINKRLQVATTISPCEMILINTEDFKSVDELINHAALSLNEKYLFLKQVPLFKHFEEFSIYRLACAIEVKFISKDQLVCRRGRPSDTLNFIYNGRVDIVSDLDDSAPLAKLQKYDYFGESSILRSIYVEGDKHSEGSKKHSKRKHGHAKKGKSEEEGEIKPTYHFKECFDCKGASSLEVLCLSKSSFYLLDTIALQQLRTAYIGRMKWRATRADTVMEEQDMQSKEMALLLSQGNVVKEVENKFVVDSSTPLDLKEYGISQHTQAKRDISELPNINQKLNPITLLATSGDAMVFKKNKAMLDRLLVMQNQRRPKTSTALGFTTLFGRPEPTLHAEIAMNPEESHSIVERKESTRTRRQRGTSSAPSPNGFVVAPDQKKIVQDTMESLSLDMTERRPTTATAVEGRVNGSQKIPPRASYCEMDRVLKLSGGKSNNNTKQGNTAADGANRGVTR